MKNNFIKPPFNVSLLVKKSKKLAFSASFGIGEEEFGVVSDKIKKDYKKLLSNFDYISVKRDNIQHIEKSSTAWLVNSIEGLRIRTSPWGEKIGLLEHQTELYQTEDSLYPFYDEIDNIRGFWIPVKVVNNIIIKFFNHNTAFFKNTKFKSS